jgi:hypothetical protein
MPRADQPPRRLLFARAVLSLFALVLIAISIVRIAEATSGRIEVLGIVVPLALGLLAASALVLMGRPGRWRFVAGLVGMSAAAIAGLFPVVLVVWAAGYYAMPPADVALYMTLAGLPLLLSGLGMVAIVTSRGWFWRVAPATRHR